MRVGQRHMSSLQKSSEAEKKRISPYICALAFLLLSLVIGIAIGSTKLELGTILRIIAGKADGTPEARIFWYVRLPRTLSCIVCGGALAVSGAVIQGVLANRLASPSIIGVNSGAGLAVTVCTAFGIYGGWQLSLFSFIGAFAAVMLISIAATKWNASKSTVILIGVALNSFFNAISDSIITLNPSIGVMSTDFKIGDFSATTYGKLIPASAVIIIATLLLCTMSNELEVLTLGEESARSLGMNAGRKRVLFLVLAAILAGCAVSIAGLLSFVGLLIPHAVRKVSGSSYKHLLPLSAIYGSAFVAVCDTTARSLFAPYEIPVGIIMSFLGAPFFIFLLIKKKGVHT